MVLVGVFVFECVFQHYFMNGNFNFILPYSFPAVHGILFAMAAFLCLARYLDGGRRKGLVFAGGFAGLCFLCKIEIAGALLVPLALMPFWMRFKARAGMKAAWRDTAAWGAPFGIVAVAGLLPFILAGSFHQVVWRNVFKPQLVDFGANLFFMEHLGVHQLNINLGMIGKSLLLWAGLAAAAGLAGAMVAKKTGTEKRGLSLLLGLLLGAGVLGAAWGIQIRGEGHPGGFELANLGYRCMPVAGLVVFVASVFSSFSRRGAIRPRDARLTAFSLFALLCLLRIFFTAGTFHYGFCLGLPSLVLFAVFLADVLPSWFTAAARNPRFYGAAVLGFMLLLAARNFACVSMVYYPEKEVALTGPGGTMKALPFPYGLNLKAALEHLEKHAEPGHTLLVLPEGAALNFLTGQPNPTYYNLFIPPELNGPGVEQDVIARIEASKVDRILLLDRPVVEYNFRGLGVDYGLELMQYIREHYEEETSFGPPPYGTVPGGYVIYRRKK
jgi:hypothetical protein